MDRGDLVGYFGSSGHLEIAVRDGDAARELSAGPDTVIVLRTHDHGGA